MATLTAYRAGSREADVTFGEQVSASDGADFGGSPPEDEEAPPISPSIGGAAFYPDFVNVLTPGVALWRDVRALANEKTWVMVVWVPPGETWSVAWVPGDLPPVGQMVWQMADLFGAPTGPEHDMRTEPEVGPLESSSVVLFTYRGGVPCGDGLNASGAGGAKCPAIQAECLETE